MYHKIAVLTKGLNLAIFPAKRLRGSRPCAILKKLPFGLKIKPDSNRKEMAFDYAAPELKFKSGKDIASTRFLEDGV